MKKQQTPKVLAERIYGELEKSYDLVFTNGVVDDVIEVPVAHYNAFRRVLNDLESLKQHLAELPTVEQVSQRRSGPSRSTVRRWKKEEKARPS